MTKNESKFIKFLKIHTSQLEKNRNLRWLTTYTGRKYTDWTYKLKKNGQYSFKIEIDGYRISVKNIKKDGIESEVISVKSEKGTLKEVFSNEDRKNLISHFLYDKYLKEKTSGNLLNDVIEFIDMHNKIYQENENESS